METSSNPFSFRSVIIAIAIAIGLLWTQYSGSIARIIFPNGIFNLPYSRSFIASLSDILIMGILICLSANMKPVKLLSLSGLMASPKKPLLIMVPVFSIVGLLGLVFLPIANDLRFADIMWKGVGGPISEEIVFRGLVIGALMQIAAWRFLPAVLIPAMFFGLAHIAQGQTLLDSVSIMAITGIGGLIFGWLFVRWGFNLWPAIIVHIGLNSLWLIFNFGETALGGWLGNIIRVAIIIYVILMTLRFSTKPLKNNDN